MKMTKKKRQVIEHAVQLFSKYGYHQIGVDKICEASHVSKMTVYKYFPNKELLFEAALAEHNSRFIEGLLSTTSQQEAPTDKLKAVFAYYQHWFREAEFNGCLFINAMSQFCDGNPNVLKYARQNKAMTKQLIESILCFLVDDDDAKQLTAQIAKLLDGAIISAQLGDEENPINSAWQATSTLLKASHVELDGKAFA